MYKMSVKSVIFLLLCIQTIVSYTCGTHLVPLEIYEPPHSPSSLLVKTLGHQFNHHHHNLKQKQQHQLVAAAIVKRDYRADDGHKDLLSEHRPSNFRIGEHRKSRNLQLDSGGARIDQMQQPRILYQVGVSF